MTKEAEKIMEEGWKARENLDFDESEKLLNQAKEMFEKSEDWFNVTEALNHLAYLEKTRVIQHIIKGLEFAKLSDAVAKKYSTKRVLVLRALLSLAGTAGLYEQALKWANECLNEFSKPMPKADIMAHIATFQLRTGNLTEAEKTINEALTLIDKHFEEEKEPHRSIWKSKILLTKGLILYNKGNLKEAKEYMEKALNVAIDENLKTRQAEIRAALEIFN